MAEVSIITPVYNSAKYLPRMIESIKAQTFEDWELLLINDGSTDNSAEIIEQYAAEDSRIHLIAQENAGPAHARNVGIMVAQGRYLSFVDSDDTVEPQMLERFYIAATEYGANIVMCNFATMNNETRMESHHGFTCHAIMSQEQLLQQVFVKYFTKDMVGVPSLCNKFVDRVWLNEQGILIPENRVRAEDWLFNLRCLESQPRFCAIDDVLYNYWQNEGSIMHSVREGEWKQHFESVEILKKIDEKYHFHMLDLLATRYVGIIIEYMVLLLKADHTAMPKIDEILVHPFYQSLLRDASLKVLPTTYRFLAFLQRSRLYTLNRWLLKQIAQR